MTLARHQVATSAKTRHRFVPALLVMVLAFGPGSGPTGSRGWINRWSGHLDKAVSLVLSMSEVPKVVGPGGGQVVVQANLYDAGRCQIKLLSHQSFPVVYAKGARRCVASFRATVRIGANPSPADRVVTLELVATHERYNALAGPLCTVVPFHIVVLDREHTGYVTRSKSGNWSGYAAEGGPFRTVAASFVVPYARPSECGEDLEQWVGVDGAANRDLIQAGIEESNANPSTGLCAGGKFRVRAWWEVLPGALVPVSMAVHPGDLMDVAVLELGRHRWKIALEDATTGTSFSKLARYSGPASSAEWIVEAPTVFAWTVPLMPYGAAAFGGLRLNGQVTVLNDIWLIQNETALSLPNSVPSLAYLLANGFSVVYAA
jgi:hypothetical protein